MGSRGASAALNATQQSVSMKVSQKSGSLENRWGDAMKNLAAAKPGSEEYGQAINELRDVDQKLSQKVGKKYGFDVWVNGANELGENSTTMPNGEIVYVGNNAAGAIRVERRSANKPIVRRYFDNYNDAYKWASERFW